MTRFGKIIANTRPNNMEIYLDGNPVLDSHGMIAKTPSIISYVTEGVHSVTFSKLGYDSTTVMINVEEGSDTYARAVLSTKFIRYPMMLSSERQNVEPEQPYPPVSPVPPVPYWEFPYGHIAAVTAPYGADVYIDGQPVLGPTGKIVTTPVIITNIPTGGHWVTFKKEGYHDEDVPVYVDTGTYSDANIVMRPRFSVPKIPYRVSNASSGSLQPAPGWPVLPIPQIPIGYIAANTGPDGAEVYLDGQPILDSIGRVVTTPVTILNVTTGRHKITFKKDGYLDEDIYVYVENGLYSDVRAALIPKTGSLTLSALGDLFIDSNPQGGYIYIDGNALIDLNGRALLTPVRITAVREGLHEVQVSLDGYYSKKVFINIIPDQVNNISVTLQPIYG